MLQKPCLPVQSPATPKTPAVTLQRRTGPLQSSPPRSSPPHASSARGAFCGDKAAKSRPGATPWRRRAAVRRASNARASARRDSAVDPREVGKRCSTLRTTYVPSARVLAIFGVEMKMKVNKQRFSSVFSLSAVLPMSSAVPPSPPRHPGSIPEPMLLV